MSNFSPSAPAPQLLRWTRFASNSGGTGPEKRSAQILDIVRQAGYELQDIASLVHFPRAAVFSAGIRELIRHGRQASLDRAGVGLMGYRALLYRQALAAHPGPKVLLWETTYDIVLPTLAREAGYSVVALPHNLESLVSDAVFQSAAYDPTPDLAAEINRLRVANAIYTISREERWLLEARGLAPDYLPFFPPAELATECASIRARRLGATDANGAITGGPLLILGSAFNPATARGMRQQLEWLHHRSNPANKLIVVGPETDRRFTGFAGPNLQILGAVSRERLVELLVQCSALLVHTYGGAGAVTRLPEALLAGIPIVANSNAARDQHGVDGIYLYENEAEFHSLTSRPLPIPPAPAFPAAAIQRFQDTLQKLVKKNTP